MAEFCPPDDIIYLILLFLPVKTLMRFHIVSKQWNNTIKSRAFAKEYLLMHSGNNTNVLLMSTSTGYSYHCCVDSNFDVPRVMNVKVELPFKKYIDGTSSSHWCGVSSSCDGLVCLVYHCNDRAILFVWNPLTNSYKEIAWPLDHVTKQEVEYAFVGFGYDHIIKDYKIVVSTYIDKFPSVPEHDQVNVMTLSTNVWRTVKAAGWKDCFKCKVALDPKPVFIGGKVFWLGMDRHGKIQILLKFNLVEERLTFNSMRGRWTSSRDICGLQFMQPCKLGQYKGSLCYYVYTTGSIRRGHRYSEFKAWALEEVGQKHNSIRFIDKHDVPAPTVGSTLAEPVGFDRDGDVLLMTVDNGRGLAANYFCKENELMELKFSEQIEHEVEDVCLLAFRDGESDLSLN